VKNIIRVMFVFLFLLFPCVGLGQYFLCWPRGEKGVEKMSVGRGRGRRGRVGTGEEEREDNEGEKEGEKREGEKKGSRGEGKEREEWKRQRKVGSGGERKKRRGRRRIVGEDVQQRIGMEN
jgi:hypothetical protein